MATTRKANPQTFGSVELARLGALVGAVFALVSCVSLSGEARDMFAFGESCPPGKVSVVPAQQALPQACVDQSGWHLEHRSV
jgi:hypothetical protein